MTKEQFLRLEETHPRLLQVLLLLSPVADTIACVVPSADVTRLVVGMGVRGWDS
jgi:hypothetical protein